MERASDGETTEDPTGRDTGWPTAAWGGLLVGYHRDVITSSAYRIGPFEVESALVEHAAVAEAAVVGKPEPERTEIVCASVILAPGHEPSTELTRGIQDHVKRLTAPDGNPREVRYVSELPKTVSGKIRRTECRDWLRTSIPEGVELPVL
jgi:acetyl-CoA synthetase